MINEDELKGILDTDISDEDLEEMFNIEIVREILREKVGDVVDTDSTIVNDMWDKCGGNPWNAGILYDLEKLK